MASTIQISVLAETRKAREELQKVNGSLGSMEKSVKSGAGVFKGIMGAGLVGAGLGIASGLLSEFTGLLGDSIGEARESQKVGKVTAQVIKATGGAAKISSSQVGDLATSLSNKTGVDDELIQSGANVLLTFKNIRNEAGEGNDVFNQLTQAGLDLAATGFGEPASNAKLLGKAFNDPIKGIGLLNKAGVTFTDQQKEQVKALIKSGDVLGAQKVLLGEVQGQVGGVAEASASSSDKFKVMVGNIKEQIGGILLPYLDQFADFFTTTLGPAISRGLEKVGPIIGGVVTFVTGAIDKVKAVIAGLSGGGAGNGFVSYFNSIRTAATTVFRIVKQVFVAIVGAFQANMPAIRSVGTSIMSIYQSIGQIVGTVVARISAAWKVLGPVILPIVKNVFGTIIQVISSAFRIVAGLFKVISAVMRGDWRGAWNGIKQIVSGVVGIVKALVNGMRANIAVAFGAIKSLASSIWSAVVSTIKNKINEAVSAVRNLKSRAVGAVSGMSGALVSAGRNLISGFVNGISGSIGRVIAKAREVASAAVRAVKGALGINSPSRVFKEIGEFATQGLDIGFSPRETAKTGELAARGLVKGFSTPRLAMATLGSPGASGGSSAGGATTLNFANDPLAKVLLDMIQKQLKLNGKKLMVVPA